MEQYKNYLVSGDAERFIRIHLTGTLKRVVERN
jgi:hypothetical protein